MVAIYGADRWMGDMEDTCHDWYFGVLLQSLQAKRKEILSHIEITV
jgi:hypothetical protein